jgi:hypothetical protein
MFWIAEAYSNFSPIFLSRAVADRFEIWTQTPISKPLSSFYGRAHSTRPRAKRSTSSPNLSRLILFLGRTDVIDHPAGRRSL